MSEQKNCSKKSLPNVNCNKRLQNVSQMKEDLPASVFTSHLPSLRQGTKTSHLTYKSAWTGENSKILGSSHSNQKYFLGKEKFLNQSEKQEQVNCKQVNSGRNVGLRVRRLGFGSAITTALFFNLVLHVLAINIQFTR